MEIRKLEQLTHNPTLEWGTNGYETDTIYVISAIGTEHSFEFSIREKKQPYIKSRDMGPDDIAALNPIIKQGHSFGVFHNEELIGWVICDFRTCNNSLFIKDMLISEAYRRQNVGRLLIKAVNREARKLNCRIVEVEAQNTNYPAIQFYRNCGFMFTGINTKRYADSAETAVLMSYDLI